MEYDFIQELDNGYTIYGKNFDQLHKKELGLIYNRLVEYMVVRNKRICNPLDSIDKHCYFQLVYNPEGKLVAHCRVRPVEVSEKFGGKEYPHVDKVLVTDPKVSMFPGTAEVCMYNPEWQEQAVGTKNSIMEFYDEGHQICYRLSKFAKELVYLGTAQDKYGERSHWWATEWTT